MNEFIKNYKTFKIGLFTFMILSLMSYGTYIFYWFGKLSFCFHNKFKFSIFKEILFVSGMFALGLIEYLGFAENEAALSDDIEAMEIFQFMGGGLVLLYFFISIFISLQVRASFKKVLEEQKLENDSFYNINLFLIIIFGALYLCYKLNKITEHQEIRKIKK